MSENSSCLQNAFSYFDKIYFCLGFVKKQLKSKYKLSKFLFFQQDRKCIIYISDWIFRK